MTNWKGFGRNRLWPNLRYYPGIRLAQGFSTGVPRGVARGSARDRDCKKNKHRFLNLLAKINRSTEKYHSLLKTALTIIIVLAEIPGVARDSR
jgi:hypothetical protein